MLTPSYVPWAVLDVEPPYMKLKEDVFTSVHVCIDDWMAERLLEGPPEELT
jgi:hypothetical protein